ncbi:unnamed protein product [Chrysoparadoxa australica]
MPQRQIKGGMGDDKIHELPAPRLGSAHSLEGSLFNKTRSGPSFLRRRASHRGPDGWSESHSAATTPRETSDDSRKGSERSIGTVGEEVSEHNPSHEVIRVSTATGSPPRVVVRNLPRHPWYQFWSWIMSTSLPMLCAVIALAQLGSALFFSLFYFFFDTREKGMLLPGVSSPTFVQVFFFSISCQLQRAGIDVVIGTSYFMSIVLSLHAVARDLLYLFLASVVLQRLTSPRSPIVLSRHLLINKINANLSLSTRLLLDMTAAQLLDVSFSLDYEHMEKLVDGSTFRRFRNLKLEVSHKGSLSIGMWLRHKIDESSPLWGKSHADLVMEAASFRVVVSGIDSISSKPVATSKSYHARYHLLFNRQFLEMAQQSDDLTKVLVDFNSLDKLEWVTSVNEVGNRSLEQTFTQVATGATKKKNRLRSWLSGGTRRDSSQSM